MAICLAVAAAASCNRLIAINPKPLFQLALRALEQKAGHLISFLFDLAPGGVCPASAITDGAVVSYTAISPLPRSGERIGAV